MVRASEDGIDERPPRRQLPDNPLLNRREVRPAEQPSSDAGLIGHNDDGYGRAIGGGDDFRGARDHTDIGGPVQMPDLFDDDAIPIEEQSGPADRAFRRATHHLSPDRIR